MRLLRLPPALLVALSASPVFAQLTLDTSSADSIKENTKAIAENMVNIYTTFLNTPGVGVPGELALPYYWWHVYFLGNRRTRLMADLSQGGGGDAGIVDRLLVLYW